MKTLVGEWEGKAANGRAVQVSYRLVSGGTALMETLHPADQPEMVTLYTAIANGGKLWLPQIVERIESPDQKVLEEFAPRVRRELSVSPENLALIRQGLVGVVNESKGTAYRVHSKDIEVAGKTGTAQAVKLGEDRTGVNRGPQAARDHAWFVAFAPYENPEIAISCIVEHAGEHGGTVAAPIVGQILAHYFGRNQGPSLPPTQQAAAESQAMPAAPPPASQSATLARADQPEQERAARREPPAAPPRASDGGPGGIGGAQGAASPRPSTGRAPR